MIEKDEIAEAKALPKGSRRALLAMTTKPTLPGRDTFNANAAFNLSWRLRKYGGMVAHRVIDGRAAYYLTPLGERIRDHAKAIEAQRAETGTGSVHESAVPEGDLPKGDSR